MKQPVKHPPHRPHTPKPEPTKAPERSHRHNPRSSTSKSAQPTKKEAQEFHRFLLTDPEAHEEMMGERLFYFQDVPPESMEELQEQSQCFNGLVPDLMEGIEDHPDFPAEFSMMIPSMGEVLARLTKGQQGDIQIALGFQENVLMKMVGYERQGERALARRLGKPVSLFFKQVDAL